MATTRGTRIPGLGTRGARTDEERAHETGTHAARTRGASRYAVRAYGQEAA